MHKKSKRKKERNSRKISNNNNLARLRQKLAPRHRRVETWALLLIKPKWKRTPRLIHHRGRPFKQTKKKFKIFQKKYTYNNIAQALRSSSFKKTKKTLTFSDRRRHNYSLRRNFVLPWTNTISGNRSIAGTTFSGISRRWSRRRNFLWILRRRSWHRLLWASTILSLQKIIKTLKTHQTQKKIIKTQTLKPLQTRTTPKKKIISRLRRPFDASAMVVYHRTVEIVYCCYQREIHFVSLKPWLSLSLSSGLRFFFFSFIFFIFLKRMKI